MIIGIIGKKRSGKDTTGDYLIQKFNFKKYSFAAPLKRAAMEIFGFTDEQVNGDLKEVIDERWGVTPRNVLQVMGTELFQFDIQKHIPEFQKIGREIWVKRFQLWYQENNITDNLVITDVRFQHEVDIINKMGGVVWKVVRPSLSSIDEHPSEREMDLITGYTDVIINDGTLTDLYTKATECLLKTNV